LLAPGIRACFMKILFLIKNTSNLRTLAPVVRLLDERGHSIRLACRDVKSSDSHEHIQRIASEGSRVELVEQPFARAAGWSDLARSLRSTIDYLRYFDPVYRDSTKLRERARHEAPAGFRRAADLAVKAPGGAKAARKTLQAVERCLAPPPRATEFLAEQDPDVLVITPLVGFGTPQAEFVRAAQRLGIPVCFPVRSWDNLTNKGLLRDAPDRVLVWNDLQRREAVEMHGVPAERVVVTGAQAYDHWFDWEPSRSREAFCAEVGLDAVEPIVLYVGSSSFIAPHEPAFVKRWAAELRERGGLLASAGLLVRPHPLHANGFHDLVIDDPQVSIWPRYGELPLGTGPRQNFYDSLHHSAAVVGINTTAQIEAAIVGRPVHTLLADEYRDTQGGTIHFHYLANDEFGQLHVGRTFAEHAAQLERSLAEGDPDGLNERFVRRFVRPLGLDVAATPVAADAIEELGRRRRRAEPGPRLGPAVRFALEPLAKHLGDKRRAQKSRRRADPLEDLRRTVRDLVRQNRGVPVVAGPWLADEIGELVYWVPFVRRTMRITLDLPDRLVVVARSASLPWYEGLAQRCFALEELGDELEQALADELGTPDFLRLRQELVEPHREALAGQDFFARLRDLRLEFAPLPVPFADTAPELPERYVAVRLDDGAPPVLADAARALDVPAVMLDAFDRQAEIGVIARSSGFLGSYGPSAYVALLTGVRAVTVVEPGEATAADLRVAAEIGRPPFGRLDAVPAAEADPDELAGRLRTKAPAPAAA
jgi:hypothetical protein